MKWSKTHQTHKHGADVVFVVVVCRATDTSIFVYITAWVNEKSFDVFHVSQNAFFLSTGPIFKLLQLFIRCANVWFIVWPTENSAKWKFKWIFSTSFDVQYLIMISAIIDRSIDLFHYIVNCLFAMGSCAATKPDADCFVCILFGNFKFSVETRPIN